MVLSMVTGTSFGMTLSALALKCLGEGGDASDTLKLMEVDGTTHLHQLRCGLSYDLQGLYIPGGKISSINSTTVLVDEITHVNQKK